MGSCLNHVRPLAPEGQTLLQLVERDCKLGINLFRAFGVTLARAYARWILGPMSVVAVEDLVARITSLLVGSLQDPDSTLFGGPPL
jgi:hypothetical protein